MTNNKINLDLNVVEIAKIHPNPWNPNRQTERVEEAMAESISHYGMVDPLTVRPHPEKEGEYQIIDGEHRMQTCAKLGFSEIPVNVVSGLDETDAQKLTIIANETRGEADKMVLADLLNELAGSMSKEEFKVGLPYTANELDSIIGMGEIDWNVVNVPKSRPVSGDITFVFKCQSDPDTLEDFQNQLLTVVEGIEGAVMVAE